MAPLNKEKGKPTQNGSQPRTVQKMWREERYTVLLVSVFFYIVLSVLLPDKTWGAIFLDFVFLILVFSVVFEAANVHAILSVLGFLGLLAILGHIVSFFYHGSMVSKIIFSSTSILFIASAIYRISKRVLGSKIVTKNTIQGAVIIYLLVGILFSSIYALTEILIPGSFLISSSVGKLAISSVKEASRIFGYFSFVTLTTLGYGDIIPIKELSRTLTWIEAFMGQIYLTVTIARLVGMYIAQSMKKS